MAQTAKEDMSYGRLYTTRYLRRLSMIAHSECSFKWTFLGDEFSWETYLPLRTLPPRPPLRDFHIQQFDLLERCQNILLGSRRIDIILRLIQANQQPVSASQCFLSHESRKWTAL